MIPTPPRLKIMVEQMLKENPSYRGIQVRNSDVALTIIIWQRWYSVSDLPDGTIHLYRLFDLPREDNVKRWRAKFQNEFGEYLPTDWKVAKARGISRERWEEALGYSRDPAVVQRQKQLVAETEIERKWRSKDLPYGDPALSLAKKAARESSPPEEPEQQALLDVPAPPRLRTIW